MEKYIVRKKDRNIVETGDEQRDSEIKRNIETEVDLSEGAGDGEKEIEIRRNRW